MKIANTSQHLGENIRYHRNMQQIKGETMAKALGISKSALSQLESGKTDIAVSRLIDIAAFLQVDIIELLTDKSNGSVSMQLQVV